MKLEWIGIFPLLFFLLSCNEKNNLPEKPNILFITTDYTRGVDMPTVGAPFIQMPTVEKWSQEGAVFTRHSSVSPICMPARATIVTGAYPHTHNLWDNTSISVKKEGQPFLITELKKQGYTTVGIGKMHFHPFKADYDYDYRVTLEGKDRNYRDDDYEAYLAEHGSSRQAIKNAKHKDPNIPPGMGYFDWDLDEKLHPDAFVGIKTREAIQKDVLKKDNPWFMWVSFTGPHNPWNAPKRYASIYREMEDLPEADFTKGEIDQKPIDYTRHRYGYGGGLMQHHDTLTATEQKDLRRKVRAAHYGMLSYIDEQLAQVVAELEKKDLLKNTIIVFSADHGSALFDNEMLHKGSPFPTQSIVPFIVWYPGFVKPGKRDNFSSHADVYATFLELAGIENIPQTEGSSLVPMLRSPKTEIHDCVVIESAMVTSIMTKDWLMGVHHISKEIELYDLWQDPMCHYNLAGEEGYQTIIEDLRGRLVNWRKERANGASVNEDPLQWYAELGDTAQVNKYWKRYTNEYKRLVNIPDEKPGITGKVAAAIVKKLKPFE